MFAELNPKPLSFYWQSNKGFGFLFESYSTIPALYPEKEEVIKAFKMGMDKYIKETKEKAQKTLECWRKNDPKVSVSIKVDYYDSDIQKKIEEYANK